MLSFLAASSKIIISKANYLFIIVGQSRASRTDKDLYRRETMECSEFKTESENSRTTIDKKLMQTAQTKQQAGRGNLQRLLRKNDIIMYGKLWEYQFLRNSD